MGVLLSKSTVVGGIETESFASKTFSDYYIALKSKHNCRRCHGRGKLNFDDPRKGLRWVTTCDCVHRHG